MMEFLKQKYVKHFLWTQLQTFILFVFVSALLANLCDAGWYLFYQIPFLFLYMAIQFIFFWYPQEDMSCMFNTCNCCILIICAPAFFTLFFVGFYPTTSIPFEQVNQCVVTGIQKTSLDGSEAYSLIYVNYVQDGRSYLGQGCLTNQYQGGLTDTISPYKFYQMNSTFPCGYGVVDYVKDKPNQNTTLSNSTLGNTQAIIGTGRGGGQGGEIGGKAGLKGGTSQVTSSRPSSQIHSYDTTYGYRYHPYPYYGSSSSCLQSYSFSEIKIPTWLCASDEYDLEELMTPKSCYVSYQNNQSEQAEENASNRLSQRNQKEFALISFEYPTYYPKKLLFYYILLFYYPLILSFSSIFQYTAHEILKKLDKQTSETEQSQLNNIQNEPNQENIEMNLIQNQN